MIEQTLLLKLSSPIIAENINSRLRQDYQTYQGLYQAQPAHVQEHLHNQAAALIHLMIQGAFQASFTLPESVLSLPYSDAPMAVEKVPPEMREQRVGSFFGRFIHGNLRLALIRRLSEMENSPVRSVISGAALYRYAIASYVTDDLLPKGRPVLYLTPEGEDIPNQPAEKTEPAVGFFLPQWVAINAGGQLIAKSMEEAENYLVSMQNYLALLNVAIEFAPYMVADELWQQKRYGMLGQLVNQGRALACYQLEEIIQTIQKRESQHRLDRGLRLSLPYFNDQKLVLETHNFVVIPSGIVMFVPAFVVLAAREQQLKVAGTTLLSFSTRKHLIRELRTLELAFTR